MIILYLYFFSLDMCKKYKYILFFKVIFDISIINCKNYIISDFYNCNDFISVISVIKFINNFFECFLTILYYFSTEDTLLKRLVSKTNYQCYAYSWCLIFKFIFLFLIWKVYFILVKIWLNQFKNWKRFRRYVPKIIKWRIKREFKWRVKRGVKRRVKRQFKWRVKPRKCKHN